jgi:hypothetical protein
LRKKSSVPINAEKTNNAPNSVERFKVPTVLMVMFDKKYVSCEDILGGIYSTIKQMKT